MSADPGTAGPLGGIPAGYSRALATVAAGLVVALAVAGGVGPVGVAFAGLGALLVVAGLAAWRRPLVLVGAAATAGAVLYAGATGLGTPSVLAAGAGAVVAYDLGENALSLREQVGDAAPTARVELLHAVGSVVLATTAAALGYAVFRATDTAGLGSTSGVVALLSGSALLAWLLRSRG